MFNKNDWLQWAQQSQNDNAEMKDFRHDYWRKNDATRSYLNQNNTVKENSQDKNEPVELIEGPIKDFAKWASGTHRPHLRNASGDVIKYPSHYPSHREHGPKLGEKHPKAGKPLPKSKAGKPIRAKTGEVWKDRTKEGLKTGGHLAGQWAVFGGLSGQPKERRPDVGQTNREFEESAGMQAHVKKQHASMKRERNDKPRTLKGLKARQHVPGATTLVVRDGKVKAINKNEVKPDDMLASSVQYVGNDLQELGAQGWKNVAKGAKIADMASTALTVGSIALAPFTGGLSLAGLGAAAAVKGGTKVATTLAAKGATKMATKAATKAATKTATQKATGIAGRVGTDVATYGAVNKLSGGGKPKENTTPQIQPNTIQQNTGPIAKIEPSKPQPRRLAASYDPELLEFKALSRFFKKKPVAKPPIAKPTPPVNAAPTTAPKLPETGIEKTKRRGKAITKSVAQSAGTAVAFSMMPQPKTIATTADSVQNPTGSARNV